MKRSTIRRWKRRKSSLTEHIKIPTEFLNFWINVSYYLKVVYDVNDSYTPIAQGIEHRPPEAGAAVRIRLGVYI